MWKRISSLSYILKLHKQNYSLCQSSIFAGHQDVIKMFLKINEKFSYQILYLVLEHISQDVTYVNYTEMKMPSLDSYNTG